MTLINTIIMAISEEGIAKAVGRVHDQARMEYRLAKVTIDTFQEFSEAITRYYQYHFAKCFAPGSTIARPDAEGHAKQLVERAYAHQRRTIVDAYNDAKRGSNGGLRGILDIIADGLKAESTSRYVQEVFDRYAPMTAWKERVDLVKEFIAKHRDMLPARIVHSQPEQYAHRIDILIHSYVASLERAWSRLRRQKGDRYHHA